MASGSGSRSQEGEESSWLDLGLGLGPNYPSTTTPSTTMTAAQYSSSLLPSLPWGDHQSVLGLGFGDDGGVRRPAGAMHYCQGWHYQSLANLPSSSSSIFPAASLFLSSRRVRPEVGLWFSLVALPGWRSESEALPQIPKAYIRVKDENMTILTVKKYLVRKLGLVGEFEIQISCMGVKLSNSQTLRHVRDTVWIKGLEQSLSSIESSHPSLHLMPLRYSKSGQWSGLCGVPHAAKLGGQVLTHLRWQVLNELKSAEYLNPPKIAGDGDLSPCVANLSGSSLICVS